MDILIIDDELPTLRMFRLLLEAMEHTVHTAQTGEEGLEQLMAHPVPLVLTDIKMPGMDGIEVLRAIKQQACATEVIVITGHGDMELAVKALNLDATDFINKPVRKEQLEAAIGRAEERLQQRDMNIKELALSVETGEAGVTLSIRGTLGSAAEEQLRSTFDEIQAAGMPVVLDFDATTSVNGMALTVLGECIRSLRQGKSGKPPVAVTIRGLSQNFQDVFAVMGITALVTMEGTSR